MISRPRAIRQAVPCPFRVTVNFHKIPDALLSRRCYDPCSGLVAYGGAWVHHFRHRNRPLRHRMGAVGHHWRAASRGARDRYAAAAVSALSRCPRTSSARRMSRSRSRASSALLRGAACDFSDVALDMTGIPAFNQRVYAYRARDPARRDPDLCARSPRPCAHPARSIRWRRRSRRNPFMIIVPCHRVLEAGNYADKISPNGGGDLQAAAAVDRGRQPDRQQDPVRRAAAGCAAARAYLNLRDDGDHASRTQIDFRFRLPLHRRAGRQAVCGAASLPFDFLCAQGQFRPALPRQVHRTGGGIGADRPSRRRIYLHPRPRLRRRVPVVLP